jgi:enterochelin esterase family protein
MLMSAGLLTALCLAPLLLPLKAHAAEEPGGPTVGDGSDAGAQAAPPSGGSPRLAALAHELEKGNREALAAFWKEMQGKAPLVEPIPGDKRHGRVTFLWRGNDKTTRVTMLGGFPGANFTKPLARLKDTDLWYLTETYPTEARFGYFFYVNAPEALPWNMKELRRVIERHEPRRDPLNTRESGGGSYLELPDAPPQPWIKRRDDVPHGKLTEQKFKSEILKAEYGLTVYVPPGSDKPGRRCWLMVAFDGGFPMMEVTLDNLLAAGKIPPVVVVGVKNIDGRSRDRDLSGSEAFANFLAKELVPWARKTYQVHDSPDHTIVGGASLGGLMAAYCGLKHSDVFGKILAQSGTFLQPPGQDWPSPAWDGEAPGLLAREFIKSPRLPLDFYLEVGRYETFLSYSPLFETRRLRDVLEAKGYHLTYSEFVGGHNEVCWRGSFADAVMALTAEPAGKSR